MRLKNLAVGLLVIVVVIGAFFASAVAELKGEAAAAAAAAENPAVAILRTADNTVDELPLEEIVVGVLAAEMPVSFEPEALKAQAVAARSYIVKRLPPPLGSGLSVHVGNAYICDDFAHCQAYRDEAGRQERWGEDFAENEAKIRAAVTETAGLVLCSRGELLSPTFHSTCGGMTEAAGDYWQTDVPALQPVPCYWDNKAPRYTSNVFFSRAELAEKLEVTAEQLNDLKKSAVSAAGRVMEVSCGGKSWKGSAFRTLLGLNSTDFDWLATPAGFYFTVQGYGHGVGLCQYGADGLAAVGADFRDILTHYYTDVEITPIAELLPE